MALALVAWLFWSFAAPAQPSPQDDLRQGLTSLNQNDLVHARELLERAAKADPRSAVVWVALAQTYLKSGQKDMALQAAGRAEQFGGDAPVVQHSLALFYAGYGQVLLEHGDFAEALAVLEKGQRQFPKDPQIVLAYGVACYAQRRFADSVGAFLQVIRLDDSIEQPYVFLGRILEHAGERLPEVVAFYAAWEKKAPGNYLPVFLHAKALCASSNPDALEIGTKLRRSIELNGSYWESHLELGALLSRQSKWPEAERELARGIELNPREARAHYELARVYLRLGKPGLAQAERAEYQRLRNAENATGLP
jgi:tetratricopeptide (TPR) repeat protein